MEFIIITSLLIIYLVFQRIQEKKDENFENRDN